jgi:hypothetical protein
MAAVKDFSRSRVSGPKEWRVIREAYAETYPVRPLLNHVDELREALRYMHDSHHKQPCVCWIADLIRESSHSGEVK